MTSTKSVEASPLRRRMIEDMSVRKFTEKTQQDYIRHVEQFAKFLGRSPDTATGEDLRRYQVHQTKSGVQPPTVNSSAVALRFLLTVTEVMRPYKEPVSAEMREKLIVGIAAG